MSECECNITAKLKQERDELAAQVEVMREALQKIKDTPHMHQDKFTLSALAIAIEALSITGRPDALREIQARTLEEAASSPEFEHGSYARKLRELAAAIRKGE